MKLIKVVVLVLVVLFGASLFAYALESTREAMILDMDGGVSVRVSGGISMPAEIGMVLKQGDAIITSQGAFALVQIGGVETATVEVSENSRVMLSELLSNDADSSQSTLLDLAMGKVLIKAAKLHSDKSKFEVKTPTSVVGVRGTTFEVQVEGIE